MTPPVEHGYPSDVGSRQPQHASPDRTLAIVPAYNEAGGVRSVVTQLLGHPGIDVLVVDDGSTDETAALASEAGAEVVRLPINLGIGGALRTGFRIARDRGYSSAFQFDADGQHDAGHIETILEPVRAGSADLVVGSRFADGGKNYSVGGVRRFVMKVLAHSVSRVAGTRLTDVSSGFRAFGPRCLAFFADEYPQDYMESVEALVMAVRAGLRVQEVPVEMAARAWGEPSAHDALAAIKTVRMLMSVLLVRLVPTREAPWA